MLIITTAALVIGWRQAVRALEPAAEMALVGEAGGGGNLGRVQLVSQQDSSGAQPHPIRMRRLTKGLPELLKTA